MRNADPEAAFPKIWRRIAHFRRVFFTTLLLAAGILLILLYLDSLAEKKHEKDFNERQLHLATLVRFAAEDRLAAVRAVSESLGRSIAARVPEGDPNGGLALEMLNRALDAAPDALGFYFVPGLSAGKNVAAAYMFRPTRAGREALLFAARAAEPFKSGELVPGEAARISGTAGESGRTRVVLLAEEVRSEEGYGGVLLTAADLPSLILKYAVPMTMGGESFGAVLHEDGLMVFSPDSTGLDETEMRAENPEVIAMAGLVEKALSGMDVMEISSGGEVKRMFAAWNSLKIGSRRLSVVLASSGEIRAGGLSYMKLQRNLLTGILLVFALLGVFLFSGKQKREDVERREATLRAIFDNAPSGIAILGDDGKFLSCNPTWEVMTGQSEERLRQKTIGDLAVPGCPGAASLKEALRDHPESFSTEVKFLRPDGPEFWGSVLLATMESYPSSDSDVVLALISDITGLKAAEEQLRKGTAALESQKEELEKQTSDQGILLDLFTLFAGADAPKQIFDALNGSLPSVISFRSLFLCVSVPGKKNDYVVLDSLGDAEKTGQTDFGTEKKGIVGHVLSTGKPYVSGDLKSDPLYVPHADEARSLLAVPISYKGRDWGVLGMDNAEPYAFSVRERDLLGLVGFYLALHLEEMETRSELDGKAQQLRFLHGVVQQLAAERVNVNLSRKIVHILGKELGFAMAGVFVPDGASEAGVSLLEGYPGGSGPWEEAVFAGLSDAAAKVLQTGKPALSSGETDPEGLAAPIAFGSEVFAVLAARGEGAVSSSDRELLEIIAEHGATFWLLNNMLAERRREALIDPLTQVWNRRFLLQRLEEETARLRRTGGLGAVVLVDLGDFKSINDRFGHLAGDEVLRKTASMMDENLRTCDVIGRFGGDEFLLYLPDVGADRAVSAMKRMDGLAAELRIPGVDATVVLDYGIASFPDDGDDLVAVIGDADARMYKYKAARKAGRP